MKRLLKFSLLFVLMIIIGLASTNVLLDNTKKKMLENSQNYVPTYSCREGTWKRISGYADGSIVEYCDCCSEGETSSGGVYAVCTKCPAGTSSNCGPCFPCNDGYISKEGGKCTKCPNGQTSNNDHTECVDAFCFIRRNNGQDNEYCYGSQERCSGFSEKIGSDESLCQEEEACYTDSNGKYVSGKLKGQSNYRYYGEKCPYCYRASDGKYRWTNSPQENEFLEIGIDNETSCINKKSSGFNPILLILLVVIIVVIVIVVLSMKKNPVDNKKNIQNNNYRM